MHWNYCVPIDTLDLPDHEFRQLYSHDVFQVASYSFTAFGFAPCRAGSRAGALEALAKDGILSFEVTLH